MLSKKKNVIVVIIRIIMQTRKHENLVWSVLNLNCSPIRLLCVHFILRDSAFHDDETSRLGGEKRFVL